MKNTDSQLNSPLEMMVHNMHVDIQSRTRHGRWKMLLVLMLCAAPVIASYLTYYVIRPQHSEFFTVKSFGELIEPQRPMPVMDARTLRDHVVPLASLRGQWLLVRLGGGACNESCLKDLYVQRQLRETLGAEKDRLDWVWLITDDVPLSSALSARLNDPVIKGFTALRVPKNEVLIWLQVASGQENAYFYLIDPQGNYMMRFPEGLSLDMVVKVKADINRLLRASSFWDTPGRGVKP
jgi:hypothetical protein